jgi:hypothetical protein
MFLITQLIFWAFFTEKFKNINKQNLDREPVIDKFLNQEKLE